MEECRGARSLEYDLTTGQGVVSSRAVFHCDLLRLPSDRMHLFLCFIGTVPVVFGFWALESADICEGFLNINLGCLDMQFYYIL